MRDGIIYRALPGENGGPGKVQNCAFLLEDIISAVKIKNDPRRQAFAASSSMTMIRKERKNEIFVVLNIY
jgi:hypothetical protein